MTGLDYAVLTRDSRRAQGLPDYVEDVATLAKVTALMRDEGAPKGADATSSYPSSAATPATSEAT